jgi:GTPase SAR1 family protein
VIAIVGNKCDLENIRQVSNEKAEKYAKNVGALHFLGSAKSGTGVQEIFKAVMKGIFEIKEKMYFVFLQRFVRRDLLKQATKAHMKESI